MENPKNIEEIQKILRINMLLLQVCQELCPNNNTSIKIIREGSILLELRSNQIL